MMVTTVREARSPLSLGVFLPPAPSDRASAPAHRSGDGWFPPKTQARVLSLLESLEDVELHRDLDFTKSYVQNGKVYTDRGCLNDLDLYFWYCEVDRRVGGYDLDVLKTLAQDVTVVMNPYAFEVGLDKHQAHLKLRQAGVRVPETVLFDARNLERIKRVIRDWGSAVLKPRRGYFGKGVTLIESYPMLRDVVEYISSTTGASVDGAYLLEKYYENDIHESLGTTLINGELMYGYRKRPSKIDVMGRGVSKVYDARREGGDVVKCDVSDAQARQALRAYEAMGLQMIGFDFIMHQGQPIIIDENTYPGYYEELFEQSHKDPAMELVKLIEANVQRRARSRVATPRRYRSMGAAGAL